MFQQLLTDARAALRVGGERQRWPRWVPALAAAAFAIGLAVMYFVDPRQGRGRRSQSAARLAGTGRRAIRRARQEGRRLAAEGYGLRQRLMHLGRDAELPANDATLKHKVESILFRDPDVPKGDINVNSEEGVIVLRGTARTPEQINEIEKRTRGIDGVRDVRNMLHLPNMPAHEWEEAVLAERPPVMSGDRG